MTCQDEPVPRWCLKRRGSFLISVQTSFKSVPLPCPQYLFGGHSKENGVAQGSSGRIKLSGGQAQAVFGKVSNMGRVACSCRY